MVQYKINDLIIYISKLINSLFSIFQKLIFIKLFNIKQNRWGTISNKKNLFGGWSFLTFNKMKTGILDFLTLIIIISFLKTSNNCLIITKYKRQKFKFFNFYKF